MFGSIGGPELLLIFVLALLLFGPRKLPEIGKTIGKTLAEFKRATTEFSTSLEREIEIEKLEDLRADLKSPLPTPDAGSVLDGRRRLPAGTIAKDAEAAVPVPTEDARSPAGPAPPPDGG